MSAPRLSFIVCCSCLVGWATCLALVSAGIILMGVGRIPPSQSKEVLESLLDPSSYPSVGSWLTYSREPIRFVWCNAFTLGAAHLVFAGVWAVLLLHAWRLRTWALALQVVLAGTWAITIVGLPAAGLTFLSGLWGLHLTLGVRSRTPLA